MKSTRLLLRESTFEDCQLFSRWEKQDFLMDAFTIESDRDYQKILREFFSRENDSTKKQFTIVFRPTGVPIGRIYLAKLDLSTSSVEINRIYLGEAAYLRQGIGEEAMQILLRYCFETLQLERVYLDHFMDNQRAGSLYLKLGFQYEGILRNATKKNGAFYNLHLMSLLQSEYFAACPDSKAGAKN
jgi:RimJ/RimL family protein N-acetyltransferase